MDEGEASLAVGCRGTELSVWDLASRQRSYLAKSAKPNRISLVDPPHVTAVAFVPGSSATKVLFCALACAKRKLCRPYCAVKRSAPHGIKELATGMSL